MVFNATFNNIFIDGGNRSTKRKPPTWRKSLTNFMQSASITTNVVSSNPAQAMYVIKFVSDLRQVGGFLLVLRFRYRPYATCNELNRYICMLHCTDTIQK
jgi:hypothetical protein